MQCWLREGMAPAECSTTARAAPASFAQRRVHRGSPVMHLPGAVQLVTGSHIGGFELYLATPF
jgi:hypothetical protein